MSHHEKAHEERRRDEPAAGPPVADHAADVADVIDQSIILGPDEGDDEAQEATGAVDRGEASEADAAEQARSVTDPEEDYR